MVGPHKRPTYTNAAKTHAEIRCRVTLLTMSDSPYGDVRLSRARTLRGHPAFSQLLPRRALARKKCRLGAPMRMLDSTLSLRPGENACAELTWTCLQHAKQPPTTSPREPPTSRGPASSANKPPPTSTAAAAAHAAAVTAAPPPPRDKQTKNRAPPDVHTAAGLPSHPSRSPRARQLGAADAAAGSPPSNSAPPSPAGASAAVRKPASGGSGDGGAMDHSPPPPPTPLQWRCRRPSPLPTAVELVPSQTVAGARSGGAPQRAGPPSTLPPRRRGGGCASDHAISRTKGGAATGGAGRRAPWSVQVTPRHAGATVAMVGTLKRARGGVGGAGRLVGAAADRAPAVLVAGGRAPTRAWGVGRVRPPRW